MYRVSIIDLSDCRVRQVEPPTGLIADMGMPKLKVKVGDETFNRLNNTVESLWPGQGPRSINRFTRDSLKRYRRYTSARTGNRAKR